MKCSFSLVFLLGFLIFTPNLEAQKRRSPTKPAKPSNVMQKSAAKTNTAVVVDERLAVLRVEPSLFAKSIQRMRLGRIVSISASKEADGVMFYKVSAPPNNFGWVQSDAVFGKFRRGDDERLAKLVLSSDGFEKIERAQIFLETFGSSPLRPPILLLLGDLAEDAALKISSDATKKSDRREMSASGAPLNSFYLNYVSLDRYRKIGINFTFNPGTKLLHYDGTAWREIIQKFSTSSEAAEARKRLDSLKEKLERKVN